MKHKAINTILAACFAALFLVSALLRAEDYSLAAGESATISDGATHTYGTISVAGDLAVSGNSKVVATTEAVLTGGSVTVEGAGTVFGSYADTSAGKTVTLAADANGAYPLVTVRNARNYAYGVTSAGGKVAYNFSGKDLSILAGGSAENYPEGVFTFLSLGQGVVGFDTLSNGSSLTGRVEVVGNALFGRDSGYTNGKGLFHAGNFLVDVASGAAIRFSTSFNKGAFNEAGCSVVVTGAGGCQFIHSYLERGNPGDKMFFRQGAVIDVAGDVIFNSDTSSTYPSAPAWFVFSDGGVFGPSVGTVRTASFAGSNPGSNNNPATLEVESGVELTVHDLDVSREGDALVGDGAICIDASAAPRTFTANIPATDGAGAANRLAIAKTGANEAVVAVTNLPALQVRQGTVRLTRDCTVGALSGAVGATLVADGCVVTIGDGDMTGGLALETANGGSFVKSGAGLATFFDTASLGGTIRIASGELAFSARGVAAKFLRWTFTKTATSPNPLWLGRLWLFDIDGGHAGADMNYEGLDGTIREGRLRWKCGTAGESPTADDEAKSYQGIQYVRKATASDLVNSMNNFAMLATPVVDPSDPATWLSLELHLPAADKPVSGYNIMVPFGADDASSVARSPVSWKVEASSDGETWTEIETRTDVDMGANAARGRFYDGESCTAANNARGAPVEHFKFAKIGGLAADAAKAVTLQVDAGATADLSAFTVAPQKIAGITVDFAEGGGTIRGGALAQGGTLTILNGAQGFAMGAPLPVALSGVDASSIGSWSAMVDGAPVSCRVKLDADGHPVLLPLGTVVFFR